MNPNWQPGPSEPTLGENEAHVWYCDFSDIRDFANGFEVLSEAEQQRAARFRTEESQLTFTGSHIFLRRVLESYLRVPAAQIRFSAGTNGKPCLDRLAHAIDVQFNLSHSHRSAACAVAHRVAVGIDLERPDPNLREDDTAKQVFGPEELGYLRDRGPAERVTAFLRGWTKKEAYLKCKGTGLAADLTGLVLGFGEGSSVFGGVSLLSFQCPNGYVASLAVESTSMAVSCWALPPAELINLQ